jgi:hypothetical protein
MFREIWCVLDELGWIGYEVMFYKHQLFQQFVDFLLLRLHMCSLYSKTDMKLTQ